MRVARICHGIRRGLLLSACLVLAACAGAPTRDTSPTFVVVRHAEKASDDARDPALSAIGERHAAALAARLRDEPLTAAYATPYRRTQQTARPAAEAHGLGVASYAADLPAGELALRLRRDHPGGTVLVVGHSNTVPGIVGALCDCAVAPLDEDDYGDLYRIRQGAAGRAELVQERF
jgi:broad specificity phosphatase PhoE